MSKPGHNSGKGGPIDPAKLKSYVERIEAVEAEEADYKTAKKDIYVEVKAAGLRPKMVRRLVKDRKKTEADAEDEAELELYRAALAMPGATYRSVSAKTGIPKSTLQRLVPRNKNGTEPKPEDGDDGITDAAGRFPGEQGDENAPLNLRVPEADGRSDREDGSRAGSGEGVQRRAGFRTSGWTGQDVRDPRASIERHVGQRGDHALAGRDAASAAVDEAPATPSVGAGNGPTDEGGRRLRASLFKPHDYTTGFVAIGANSYIVFMHCSEGQWLHGRETVWEGVPVEWRWDIGQAEALSATPFLGDDPGDPPPFLRRGRGA